MGDFSARNDHNFFGDSLVNENPIPFAHRRPVVFSALAGHGRSYHQAFPLATIYLPKHGTRRRDDATLELAGPPLDEIQNCTDAVCRGPTTDGAVAIAHD